MKRLHRSPAFGTAKKTKTDFSNTTEIIHIPIEVMDLIFQYLTLSELVQNVAKTSMYWRQIVSNILKVKLPRLATTSPMLKKEIEANGLTDVFSLYEKYQYYSSK